MFKAKRLLLATLFLSFLLTFVQLIVLDDVVPLVYSHDGAILLVKPQSNLHINTNIEQTLQNMGINAKNSLQLTSQTKGTSTNVYHYNQIYNNTQVYGRALKITTDNQGKITAITGNFLNNLNIAQLKNNDNCDNNQVQAINAIKNIYSQANIHQIDRVVYSLAPHNPQYAYQIQTDLNQGTTFFVSEDNNQILSTINKVKNLGLPVSITHNDYFNNTIELNVDYYNDYYYLTDGYKNISLYDSAGMQSTSSAQLISSHNASFSRLAITAYKNLIDTFDYFADEQNTGFFINGIDNSLNDIYGDQSQSNEVNIKAYINYGTNFDNAYYGGGIQNKSPYFVFGNGAGSPSYAIAKDVVAHEYQHAMNDHYSQLQYLNESGALDEALADLFGALVEGNSMDNPNFWKMGEDMSNNMGIRDISAPEKHGYKSNYQNRYPACYQTHDHSNCDNGGVHYNSTIISHAVYQMYQHATQNQIHTFNKQNLAKMLFLTMQQIPPNCNFSEFRAVFEYSLNSLPLTQQQKEELGQTIAHGFNYVGVNLSSPKEFTIEFALSQGFSGPLPPTITKTEGTTFLLNESQIQRSGYKIVGWTQGEGKGDYLFNQQYTMPPFNLKLYPLAIPNYNNTTHSTWQGEGSKNQPYLIQNATDLATLAYYLNAEGILTPPQQIHQKYFKLTAHINLFSVRWHPIGINTTAQFYFDGGGYSISNLNLSGNHKYQGLFGIVKGEVKNLEIKSGDCSTNSLALGSIAGLLDGGTILNCTNNAQLSNISTSGGIVGQIINGSVLNCVNSALINAQINGSIAGQAKDSYILNCINNSYTPKIVHTNTNTTLLSNKTTDQLTPQIFLNKQEWSYKNGANLYDLNAIWQLSSNNIPQLKPIMYWHNYTQPPTQSSNQHQFTISTPAQLASIFNPEYQQKSFILTADINLSGRMWLWDDFYGNIDGNGYKITNISIDGNALINTLNGKIENLLVENCLISLTNQASAIAFKNDGQIKNCSVLNSVISAKEQASAISILGEGTISNSVNYSQIYAKISAGISVNQHTQTNNTNQGEVFGELLASGIVAQTNQPATITNCINLAQISSETIASGIIGQAQADLTIISCKQAGQLNAPTTQQFVGLHLANIESQNNQTILPQQLNDYQYFLTNLAPMQFLDSITLFLNCFNTKNHFIIIFINQEQVLDIQTIPTGQDATPPQLIQKPSDNNYNYTPYWSGFYTLVNRNSLVFLSYTAQTRLYQINFNSNGGQAVEQQNLPYQSTLNPPSTTKFGFKFAGWYTDSNLTTPLLPTFKINQDLTLYAKWSINPLLIILPCLILALIATITTIIIIKRKKRVQ